jgi:four helix bundle protein
MSYKNLEIWQLARDVAIDIHRMTLNNLPKFEMYEEGIQIRKSSKSVRSTVEEGGSSSDYQISSIFWYFAPNCDHQLLMEDPLC